MEPSSSSSLPPQQQQQLILPSTTEESIATSTPHKRTISRSSLRLSQSWSTRNLFLINNESSTGATATTASSSIRPPTNSNASGNNINSNSNKNDDNDNDNDDDDDDDEIQLAFFPLLKVDSSKDTKTETTNVTSSTAAATTTTTTTTTTTVTAIATATVTPRHTDSSISTESSHRFTVEDIWDDVPMGPSDAILGIAESFKNSTDLRKVNVAVGAYRDENGIPWILPSVRLAEKRMWDSCEGKEYLPIEGDSEYIQCAMKFAYGNDIDLDHIAAVQTLSGTGACRIGGCFLAQYWPKHYIYVPNPTWGNHISIFQESGLTVRKYRYYDRTKNGLDFNGMIHDIDKAPIGSIILLHACAHNPTGCDPTIDEWKQVLHILSKKEHVAFFDSAYQGFASGDAENDAQPFRYAVSQNIPILLAQSFAKNFGLYGERCGTLSIVCGDVDQRNRILSELRCIIRPMYSSPPRHGSSIVKTILMDETLKVQYYMECQSMAHRINQMRNLLVHSLIDCGSTHDWSHITKQIGMFAYTGLNEEMCQQLTTEYAIFLTFNGRISIAGLNEYNIRYVAKSIHTVSHGKSISS